MGLYAGLSICYMLFHLLQVNGKSLQKFDQNRSKVQNTWLFTRSGSGPGGEDCFRVVLGKYTGPAYSELIDAKETARYKWMLVVTKLLNSAVNDFDAKKSACYSRVLFVTELVNGTQCTVKSVSSGHCIVK